jgi:hypothetical protein
VISLYSHFEGGMIILFIYGRQKVDILIIVKRGGLKGKGNGSSQKAVNEF